MTHELKATSQVLDLSVIGFESARVHTKKYSSRGEEPELVQIVWNDEGICDFSIGTNTHWEQFTVRLGEACPNEAGQIVHTFDNDYRLVGF